MIEKPLEGRATIGKEGNSLYISIPTRKNWFGILFLGAWLGCWYVGETSAIDQVFTKGSESFESLFLVFWLVGWTVGGILFIAVFLWKIGGRETISIDDGEMTIGKEIFGIGNYKTYRISDIKYLTLNPRQDTDQWGQTRARNLFKSGLIEFDYGLGTIKLASNIDMAEARHLIEILKSNPNFKESNFK